MKAELSERELMGHVTLEVRFVRMNPLRRWLGVWFARLAKMMLGCQLVIGDDLDD